MTTIRSLRPTDLVLLPGGGGAPVPNQVRTLSRLTGEGSRMPSLRAWWEGGVWTGRRRCLRVLEESGRPVGLVSGRARSGPTAWEVRCLYLEPADHALAVALLEEVCAVAALRGARRLFLRLPVESPLLALAARCGFVPAFQETLLRREQSCAGEETADVPGLAPRQKSDDFDLFRLFLACAPAAAQQLCALTLEEWQDMLELPGAPGEEWVARPPAVQQPRAAAWLRTWQRGAGYLQLLAAPGRATVAALLRHALGALNGRAPLFSLVPEFQGEVEAELQELGFVPTERCQLFVRPLAVGEREVGVVPAQV